MSWLLKTKRVSLPAHWTSCSIGHHCRCLHWHPCFHVPTQAFSLRLHRRPGWLGQPLLVPCAQAGTVCLLRSRSGRLRAQQGQGSHPGSRALCRTLVLGAVKEAYGGASSPLRRSPFEESTPAHGTGVLPKLPLSPFLL